MKKTLLIFLTLIMSISIGAKAENFSAVYNGKTIYYNITSSTSPKTVEVTFRGNYYSSYHNEYSGDVTIPDSVFYNGNYYKITSIGGTALYRCPELTSITIPNSVTSIESSAFNACSGLTSIIIPNSVTYLGNSAFRDCSGITSITIPSSITYVNEYAFSGCSSLTSVTIPNTVTYIGNSAFRFCSSLTSITIPNSVTSIDFAAFHECSELTSITIPNSVTTIGEAAFAYCPKLTSVIIPNSVTSIGKNAFTGCIELTSITSNAINPPTIQSNTFYNVNRSIPVNVPCGRISSYQSDTNWNTFTNIISGDKRDTIYATILNGQSYTQNGFNENISGFYNDTLQAINGCDSIITLKLSVVDKFSVVNNDGDTIYYKLTTTAAPYKAEVTFKGDSYSSFRDEYIDTINIPSSVMFNGVNIDITSIRTDAFNSCNRLKSITIPNSVTSIGDRAFEVCQNLTSAIIPNSVTTIGSNVFFGCWSLRSIAIPNSVTSIGGGAFMNCSGLTSITLPNSITSIGDFTFKGCSGLTLITIPNTVTRIYEYAFNGCSGLTNLTIPNSVTSIGREVFKGCSGLTSIILPDSLKSINMNTFQNCSGLTSITLPNTLTTIGSDAFSGCSRLTSINIPNSVNLIYQNAFYGCSSLTSINIPKNITTLGTEVFSGCTALTSITSNAINPPTIQSNTFNNVNRSIPVYVPCNISSYQTATNWNTFSNFISNGTTQYGDTIYATILQGQSYTENGFNKNISGIYNDTLQTVSGCDSIITLNLSVVDKFNLANNDGDTIYYKLTTTATPYKAEVTYKGDSFNSYINEYFDTISIPSSVMFNGVNIDITSIGDFAFNACNRLTSITIPNSMTSIGEEAFYNCDGLTSLIIPNSVTSIGEGAFESCSILRSINIPNSITSISENTFRLCRSLTSITIPSSVTSIGNMAFYGCSGLTSITIPNSVISIGQEAFSHCSGLTSITIPNSITSINSDVFESCTGLTSINIPNSVTSIGESAFENCTALTSITIPNSVTSIGDYAFGDCIGLTSINLSNSLTSIGVYAFGGCSGLTSLTIPSSVTSIDEAAFYDCSGLTSITINAINPPATNNYTFEDFNFSIPVYVPCNSLSSYQSDPNWNSFTNMIGIKNIIFVDTTICSGDSINYYGTNIDSAGVYYIVNGCDSIILTLNTNPSYNDTIFAEICQGSSYTLNGFNRNLSGFYTQNLQTSMGCDSIVNLSLTVNPALRDTIFAEICQGHTYNQFGFNESAAGFYTQNLQTENGCDSIVNLSLTVNPVYRDTIFAQICRGEVYNQFGFNEDSEGFYTQNLQSIKGCDSIVNLSLKYNSYYNGTMFVELCEGESYNAFGFNEDETGFYTQHLYTIAGCDSIMNLILVIQPKYNDTIFAEICEGDVYNQFGFNASTAGIYTQNLQSYFGCDSIVNLVLSVNQPTITNLTAEICQGETYTLNGFNVSTAGLHTQTLQTYKGCDSIVNLTLTVNQPTTTNLTAEICQGETYTLNGFNVSSAGLHTINLHSYKGCDSIVNLTLTVNQPAITNLSAEICQGKTYTLNGFNVSTTGLHTLNLQTYKGCDSTVNLTLTINQPAVTNISAEICQGETYTDNGFNVSTAGLHTLNLQTYKGCDSIINLTLTINQPATTNLTAEICQGETYTLNGFNVSTAGLHTQTLQTIKGCDSIVNLTLTINQPAITNLTAEICQGQAYNQNGFNVSTAGLHTQTLQTYKGCDSIVNLTLTVNQPAITNLTAEICQGETYTDNGFNVGTAGLHTQTLQTYKGCDSIVNLTLTVNQPAITNLTAEICQGETYTDNGFNVGTAGLHTQTLQTIKGCDSIVNLTLTVNQPAFTNLVAEICQGETYTLNGFNEDETGFYTQTLQTAKGCDSIVNLTLTVNQPAVTNLTAEICQGVTYTDNGFNVSTAGLHTQTLQTAKGCDSIVNLTLTVNQPAITNLTAEICQGETYTLNGFNVSTAGLHTQTLQTYKGCDSIVNLTLTVNQPAINNISAEICQGETYTLNGFNVSTAGLHTLNLQTVKGCDSIINLTLTVNQPAVTNISAEICQGETYTDNGFNVGTAGLHTLNLQTVKGCDSIVNLTLTVNQPAITNLTAEICQGEVYSLNGFNVNTAGLHTLNLQTYKGCDSTVNLTLTVNQPAVTNISAEICQGETYTDNGFNASTSGLHTLNLQTVKGCDSIVNLTLTVNQPAVTNLSAEICQGETYTLNGFNASTSGLHTLNLQTVKGCDSIVNLTLTVNPTAVTNISAEICQGEVYSLNGFNESTPGIYTQTLQTTKGCDSIIYLTLNVNPTIITNFTAEICQGEVYSLNGFNASTAGLYTQNLQTSKGCDSIVNLILTVNPIYFVSYSDTVCQGESYILDGIIYTADTSGRYVLNLQTINGCDSIIELNLTVIPTPNIPNNLDVQVMSNHLELSWQGNGSSYIIYRNDDYLTTTNDPSYKDYDVINNELYCYKVKSINGDCESEFTDDVCKTYLGIENISQSYISTKLYPNPSDGKSKLEVEGLDSDADILVYDMIGRVIQRHKINKGTSELEIDLSDYAEGVYSIRIMNKNINQTRKLIIQK